MLERYLPTRPGDYMSYEEKKGRNYSMKRSMTPWIFIVLGLMLIVLSSIGLYCQVQYIKMTEAPHLRTSHAFQRLIHEPGNAYANHQCVGWRQTGACSPNGEREPVNDKPCDALIQGGLSGYCEYYIPHMNETVHLLPMTCNTVRGDIYFSCNMATDIMMFHKHADVYRHPWNMKGDPSSQKYLNHDDFDPQIRSNYPAPYSAWYDQGIPSHSPTNGIVMVAYEKALVSLYATISYIRRDLSCKLPIELWYRSDELNATNPVLQSLVAFPDITLRLIEDPLAVGFYVKPYTIFFSNFQNVLFLDADNMPITDPSFIFETAEFKSTGALFWPDFWHPGWTIFNMHKDSLTWPLLNISFVDMFEQESGQLVINRAKSERALHMLMFYAFHRIKPQPVTEINSTNEGGEKPPALPTNPNLIAGLNLVWGDKDLFRLAWLKTETPFHMMQQPPGALGLYGKPHQVAENGEVLQALDNDQDDRFCGKSMVQYDTMNKPLFLHRNTVKLGMKNETRQRQWLTYQEFRADKPRKQYIITAWRELTSCFGERRGSTDAFFVTGTKDTKFEHAEILLLKYAQDAVDLLT